MKKTLLLFTCLLAFIAMPVLAQQKTVKKRVTFQLIKKRGADAAVAGKRKAAAAAQAVTNINNSVMLAYYPAAGSGAKGYENYYLVLSDKEDVSYNVNEGQIKAKSATVAELDLYAPEGTGIDLPAGTFAASEGNLYYNTDLTYVENFDDKGNSDGGVDIASDITVSKAENDGIVTYTLSFSDANGTQYSYVGEWYSTICQREALMYILRFRQTSTPLSMAVSATITATSWILRPATWCSTSTMESTTPRLAE